MPFVTINENKVFISSPFSLVFEQIRKKENALDSIRSLEKVPKTFDTNDPHSQLFSEGSEELLEKKKKNIIEELGFLKRTEKIVIGIEKIEEENSHKLPEGVQKLSKKETDEFINLIIDLEEEKKINTERFNELENRVTRDDRDVYFEFAGQDALARPNSPEGKKIAEQAKRIHELLRKNNVIPENTDNFTKDELIELDDKVDIFMSKNQEKFDKIHKEVFA